jgi:hypothetical protein
MCLFSFSVKYLEVLSTGITGGPLVSDIVWVSVFSLMDIFCGQKTSLLHIHKQILDDDLPSVSILHFYLV